MTLASIFTCAENGPVEKLEEMITKFPAVINGARFGTDSLLMRAAAGRNAGAVALLLKAGADPNARNIADNTALNIAAFVNSMPMVELWIRAGADPDQKSRDGDSPITWANHHCNVAMISALKKASRQKKEQQKNLQDVLTNGLVPLPPLFKIRLKKS